MKITIKKDEESQEHYIDFEDLKPMFDDPSLVDSYSIEHLDDGNIALSFFDEDGNLVPMRKNEEK